MTGEGVSLQAVKGSQQVSRHNVCRGVVESGAKVLESGKALLCVEGSRSGQGQITNFLKNKCTRWVNELCDWLTREVVGPVDDSQLRGVLNQLQRLLDQEVLGLEDSQKNTVNRQTALLLCKKIEDCLKLLNPECNSAEKQAIRSRLKIEMEMEQSRKSGQSKKSQSVEAVCESSLTGPFADKLQSLIKFSGKRLRGDAIKKLCDSLKQFVQGEQGKQSLWWAQRQSSSRKRAVKFHFRNPIL
ncbi:MAG: hypothetical protein ACR2PX_20240 [Endozoicomonas sp.]|uniref:hypothetical protein n=1 Tax=Endozoicomonas sp. TaxID=1892382 RepID=UPI003D9BC1FC